MTTEIETYRDATFSANTRDLIELAERIVVAAEKVIEARYAGELLDAVTALRDDFRNDLIEDAAIALGDVCASWDTDSDRRRGA